MAQSWMMLAAMDAHTIVWWLVGAAIIALVSGTITAIMATHVLKASQSALSENIFQLAKTVATQQQEISALREARAQSEAQAAARFATHGEVAQILGQNMHQWEDVLKKLDVIHGRITPLAERVSALEGALSLSRGGDDDGS